RMEDLRAADWYSARKPPPSLGAPRAGARGTAAIFFPGGDEIGADLWRFLGPGATVLFAAPRPQAFSTTGQSGSSSGSTQGSFRAAAFHSCQAPSPITASI